MASRASSFPCLLVIAEFPPNVPDGGGALVRQMLKGYAPERLWWWSSFPERGEVFGQSVQRRFCFRLPHRLYPRRRWTGLKALVLSKAWAPLAARHLRKTIAQVQPQQIWAILHGWTIPVLQIAGSAATHRCHSSIWDYQDHNSGRLRFGPHGAPRVVGMAESIYRASATCDAISRPMQEDLAERTGRRDAIVVHSGLEPAQIDALAMPIPLNAGEIRIAYAGAIVARQAFGMCIGALRAIRKQLPRPLRLEFFGAGSHRREPWFESEWMYEHGNVDDVRFHEALTRCHWGLAAMDLHDDNPRYNRFSLPNKLGTYLAAGLPLLVVGHRESTAVRLVAKCSLGFCSDSLEPAGLRKALESALRNPNPREQFRPAILDCARAEFNAARIRRALWNCFQVADDG